VWLVSAIWLICAGVFVFVIWLPAPLPVLRQFRIACFVLAVLGLAGTLGTHVSHWHLLWYTPAAIVAAYLFALRHLFALSRRLDDVERDHTGDVESLRSQVEQAVEEYNESVDDDQRLR
jgi:hypothetical protein